MRRLQETDPAESWEIPYSEDEAGSYYRNARPSHPRVPRQADEVPAGAFEALQDACGVQDLHQVFIIPLAVRSTGARGRRVVAPNSVLALGTRAVGLWTEKPRPGVRIVIPLEELAGIEDVAILLYGRLSFISRGETLRVRYNTVARRVLEPALLETRRRLSGPGLPVPRDGDAESILPYKWKNILASALVRLEEGAPAAFRFAEVPTERRREPRRGELLVVNPRELVYACDPRAASNRYGVDTFIMPRSRVTGVATAEGGCEVVSQGVRIPLAMAPALAETAARWMR